ASWTLQDGFEDLSIYATGPGMFTGTGNALDNGIYGNVYGGGALLLSGLGGNDTLTGGDGADTLLGGAGNDSLAGGYGTDSLDGGDGNDTLSAGYAGDVLTGGAGADHFIFNAWLSGDSTGRITDFSSGADKIHLDANVMWMLGTGGNFSTADPRFYAAAGASSGHDVDDRVVYNTSTGQLWYDADGSGSGAALLVTTLQGAPALLASDITVDHGGTAGVTIDGTAGNDLLFGTPANDTLNGLAGNDTLDGGPAADRLVGGPGDDVYFVDDIADVAVELENEGIDEVRSSLYEYTLPDGVNNLTLVNSAWNGTGNAMDNAIVGNANGNMLSGGGGADTLVGGLGQDALTGGAGADSFLFNAQPGTANADRVTDFVSGTDKIRLDASVLQGIGDAGDFTANDGRFYSAPGAIAAHDADDRVIYNTTTGQLFFDSDGSGPSTAQLIATLQA
ncbi:MAG TPA: calcium-binding protein, partial [Mycobacteriales bacterium]|nr:calcium-binding protein [Mycobacteriales bacterium]